uniref:adenylyltransferase/cytidyltransferase family protein n=1 Tax=Cellvibrio fontiphilus TaxID=1815559 RepID=UPI002B4BAA26|nr:adenylyltransferase/cytidyltransferase family protein [Cellvibrio fontiphilus]
MHFRTLVIGVFDLFHVGHVRYLSYARAQTEQLVVAVAPDSMCFATKNKWPIIPEYERLEMIRSLGWVDRADLQPVSTTQPELAAEWIASWGITHVIGGGGWKGSARWLELQAQLDSRRISVDFAPDTPHISTSIIMEKVKQRA